MRRGLITVAAFLAGLFAGYALSILAYILLSSAGLVADRDGGVAMGFAFTIGPVVALVCGILAAILAARRTRPPVPRP